MDKDGRPWATLLVTKSSGDASVGIKTVGKDELQIVSLNSAFDPFVCALEGRANTLTNRRDPVRRRWRRLFEQAPKQAGGQDIELPVHSRGAFAAYPQIRSAPGELSKIHYRSIARAVRAYAGNRTGSL